MTRESRGARGPREDAIGHCTTAEERNEGHLRVYAQQILEETLCRQRWSVSLRDGLAAHLGRVVDAEIRRRGK